MSKTVAIIPARGGSKRLPGKNTMSFGGKPMIAWTIEAALETGRFDQVIVSTDRPETADIARQYGAEVPALRDSHADDHSPVSLATISSLEAIGGWDDADIAVQLFSVCPLRTAEDICEALDAFEARKADFLISCYRFLWTNPYWAHRLDGAGHPSPLFPEELRQRSQDQEPLYSPTGAIWMARIGKLLEAQTFYGPDHVFHELPWQRAVDIDDADDLLFAEALLTMRQRQDGESA